MVDLKAQYGTIRKEIVSAVDKVMEDTAFILGDNVKKFEEAFADFCGSAYAVGMNSGTSALHLGLLSSGIGEGDEVITVPNTFIATAEAIAYTGAKVVFVDVDPGTMNMDVEKLRRAATEKTKAIIPVHLYGNPADMDGILQIAEEKGAVVIEDAAQAHGALYHDRKAGSIGEIGCFSFYPGKNLGACGDAGALVTDNEAVAARARMYSNHGRSEKFDHQVIGYTERLDGIQAVILSVKLKNIEMWNASRRMNAILYSLLLEDVPEIIPVEPLKGTTPVYHQYVIRVETGSRDDLRAFLSAKEIATGIHYPTPIHMTPAFRYLGYKQGDFPVSEDAASKILSLPIYPELKEDQVRFVIEAVKEYLVSL
jgi:dTDP-4-amino-4,6-dideoxygalactose transaminase